MQTRQVSHHEIQKIAKEFRTYKRSTEREIRLLNARILRLQKILEKSVIAEDNPDDYEVRAIRDFESSKKKSSSRFVPLD